MTSDFTARGANVLWRDVGTLSENRPVRYFLPVSPPHAFLYSKAARRFAGPPRG
jgi:hypothetical protein